MKYSQAVNPLLKHASLIPELDEVLSGDLDLSAFAQVILNDDLFRGINAYEFEMDSEADQALFYRLLREVGTQFGKLASTVPTLLCPSVLERCGVIGPERPYPNALVFDHFSLEDLCDEYFGVCYRPSREGNRFEKGFKQGLILALRRAGSLKAFRAFSNLGLLDDLDDGLISRQDLEDISEELAVMAYEGSED